MLERLDQGEVVVRPSSKGADHLTASWKVTNDVYQHIDIREEGKENVFSLGQSLWIGNEEFEDLDEIIARYITPMAAYVRDLLNYKYYKDTGGGMKDKAEEILKDEKSKNPNKIHYVMSVAKNYPGKFLLSYLPRTKCKHEYITVNPEGYRFRSQNFDSVNSLLKWFKEHFRDPIPSATPASTPRGATSASRTPFSGSPKYSNDAIQKLAQNIPSHMFNSLSQATSQTPRFGCASYDSGNAGNYVTTPYTPSGQTPYMTPYQQTPLSNQTPRYGSSTPSHSSSFVHPASVNVSRNRSGYQNSAPSPSNRGTISPYSSESSYGRRDTSQNEDSSWEKATNSWSSKGGFDKRSADTFSKGASRRNESIHQPRNAFASSKTSNDQKASEKSTSIIKRSETSQQLATLGDSTPLWDE